MSLFQATASELAELHAWLGESPGAWIEAVGLGTSGVLTATADVGEGGLLLRVPEERLLSPWRAASRPGTCLLSFVFEQAEDAFPDDHAALATLLMHERARGAAAVEYIPRLYRP